MLVPLYQVHIRVESSKFLTVPEYDIPLIKIVWEQYLIKNQRHGYAIEVAELNQVEFRSLHDEKLRIGRDYPTMVDGYDKLAHQIVYANPYDFSKAHAEASKKGAAIQDLVDAARTAAAADAQAKADLDAEETTAKATRMRKQAEDELREELKTKIRAEMRAELEAEAKEAAAAKAKK